MNYREKKAEVDELAHEIESLERRNIEDWWGTAKSVQVVQHVAGPAKGKDLYAAVVSSSAVSDGNIKGKQAESDMARSRR